MATPGGRRPQPKLSCDEDEPNRERVFSKVALFDAIFRSLKKGPPPPPPISHNDGCAEPGLQKVSSLSDDGPSLNGQESISKRRDRSLTALLFDGIVNTGRKLKCYENWKLWFALCICMTVIAIVAAIFATYYFVELNEYKDKLAAVKAESTLFYDVVHDPAANFSDHLDEARKIFNTFDDNDDGLWNNREYYDHFVLASTAQFVFDSIDADSDDILSWDEIVNSIVKNGLMGSYTSRIDEMYNYSFANSSEEVRAKYAANVYLSHFNIGEFRYITRAYYYEFRGNASFKKMDIDGDMAITFEEFTATVGNDQMITFLRDWDLESYLRTMNRTQTDGGDPLKVTHTDITNMCPSNIGTANMRRRLQVNGSEFRDQFDDDGYIYYEYDNYGCLARLWCVDQNGGINNRHVEGKCPQSEIDLMVECMVVAINQYFASNLTEPDCWDKTHNCFDFDLFVECRPDCHCSCSPDCEGHAAWLANQTTPSPTDARRRMGKACGTDKCACGGGCTCFSGDNEMRIKRDGRIQNVLLKDVKIGDYAVTKEGEWSKVWFIKEEESSEYEFLKLYFDEKEYITMTSHHLLYVRDRKDESMKRADEVEIGDVVFVMARHNETGFVQKEIVAVESTISAHGAYAPVTMEGSIVVGKVLSSCYVETPQKAQRLHDTAAVFRWISRWNTNLGSRVCHFFYDTFFLKLRNDYSLDAAFVVFNGYSMPCIVVATVNIAAFVFIRSFSYFV